jgi:hypothetical protein
MCSTDTDWVLQLVQMLGRTDLFPTPRTAEPEVHLVHMSKNTDWVLQLVQYLSRTDLFPSPRTAEPEVHLAHVQHEHRLGATAGTVIR